MRAIKWAWIKKQVKAELTSMSNSFGKADSGRGAQERLLGNIFRNGKEAEGKEDVEWKRR